MRIDPYIESFLIAQNDSLTMAERHAAWKEIMDVYPDRPIPASSGFEANDSLHAYLRVLIALEKRVAEDFLSPQEGYVYQYTACWSDDATGEGKSVQGLDCFSTYQRAWTAFSARWDWEKDAVTYVAFAKSKIDARDRISISVNARQEILRVFSYFSSNPDYSDIDAWAIYEWTSDAIGKGAI